MNHTEMNWLDLRTGGSNLANINTYSSVSPGIAFTLAWHLNGGYLQQSANGLHNAGNTPLWYKFLMPAVIKPRTPAHCTNPAAPPGTVCFDINQMMVTRWCMFSLIHKIVHNDPGSSPPMSLPRFGLSAMPYNAPASKYAPDIQDFAALYSTEISQPLNTRIHSIHSRNTALTYAANDYIPGPLNTTALAGWEKDIGTYYRIDLLVTHLGDLTTNTTMVGVDASLTALPSINPSDWNFGMPYGGNCPPAGTPIHHTPSTYQLGYWCLCSSPFGFPQLRLLYQFAAKHENATVDHLVAIRRLNCPNVL